MDYVEPDTDEIRALRKSIEAQAVSIQTASETLREAEIALARLVAPCKVGERFITRRGMDTSKVTLFVRVVTHKGRRWHFEWTPWGGWVPLKADGTGADSTRVPHAVWDVVNNWPPMKE